MRKIYLFRHAEPDFPGNIRRCIGSRSDYPLSNNGRNTAAKVSQCVKNLRLSAVFSSPLLRARETAEILFANSCKIQICDDLREMDCGLWDGMTFSDIREKYADIWNLRGEDLTIPPPEGEAPAPASERMLNAVLHILSISSGDIAIVSHSGAIRALVAQLTGMSFNKMRDVPQDYCSVNVLLFDDDTLSVSAAGIDSLSAPSSEMIESLWSTSESPESVRTHCVAVRNKALELSNALPAGMIDTDLLSAACELHDLYRTQKNHASLCAEKMRELGYLRIAEIIEPHHGGLNSEKIDETALLFLADKYIYETNEVSIDERFEKSHSKLASQEAIEAHKARYNKAKKIEKLYKSQISYSHTER